MPRQNLCAVWLLACGLVPAGLDHAQTAPSPSTQPMREHRVQPAEPGLRLTQTLARTMVNSVVGEHGMARYGMDEQAQQRAMTLVTERVLEFAGNNQDQVQTLLEAAFQSLCENRGRITPARAKECAELARPLVPALREMATRCAEEIRASIPPGEQLKFAGDMLLLSTLFDVSEKRLERWARGEVTDDENLNVYSSPEIDEFWAKVRGAEPKDGESVQVGAAKRNAEEWVDWTSLWRQCVDNAILYYGLDAAQKRAAESILREMEERAKGVRTEEWKAKMILNRTKYHLYCGNAKMPVWNTPWVWQLEREYRALAKPVREMTDELKDRLDTLPTDEQRRAAGTRIDEELRKRGWRE